MTRNAANVKLWIRRAHLYTGLVLVPWVLLYAASGMLFNHPSWAAKPGGPDRFALSDLVAPAQAAGVVLDEDAATAAVVAALGAPVHVMSRPPPSMRRSLRGKAGPSDGTTAPKQLSIRFPSRRGTWGARPTPIPRFPASLQGVDKIEVPEHDAAAWQRFADMVATEMEAAPTDVALTATPLLRFHAEIDGERWEVEYDAHSGDVTFAALADREANLPRLLARLHMTHVYPDTFGLSWLHALFVDLSALCLALWCVTGVFMWWQMRRLRRIGGLALVVGLAVAVVILAEVLPALNS
ncbi:MAG: hypothetical protein ACRBN8_02535 [Nannocystales bacterium]